MNLADYGFISKNYQTSTGIGVEFDSVSVKTGCDLDMFGTQRVIKKISERQEEGGLTK